jgi:hypothetical protein
MQYLKYGVYYGKRNLEILRITEISLKLIRPFLNSIIRIHRKQVFNPVVKYFL